MLWKKESALTVRNTTIMTRSRSLFFKISGSTRTHPQQERRGDPGSVLTLADTTVHCSFGFLPEVFHILAYFVCLFVSGCTGSLLPCRLLPSCSPGASHCAGVSCRRSRAPGPSGSRHRLRLTGLEALCKQGLPRPGCEPVSLELQSRFVTTGAPEKP